MAINANPAVMSVEEYLESERHSAIKHEYVDGHVYAMAGGSRAHGVIAVNVTTLLRSALRGGPCRVYNSDVKVQLTETRYVYPDASVGCDERDRLNDDEDVVRYPTVVVEVLSSSTEAYDRGAKFALYRSSETLREYVLVSTDRLAVECYRRGANDLWTLYPFGAGDEVVLESIGFKCPLAAFYEDVALPEGREHV
jgi:Uma2 family endonuclease